MLRKPLSNKDIESWLIAKIASNLQMQTRQIDKAKALIEFGFDSLHLQGFFAEIEDTFGITLDHDLILLHENLEKIAHIIFDNVSTQNPKYKLQKPKSYGLEQEQTQTTSYEQYTDFRQYPPYLNLKRMQQELGEDIFFDRQDGVSDATCIIDGKKYLNFSSYNYLGLNSHPRILKASIAATKRYGTSVSASRLVSGEKRIHQELEKAIAHLLQVEDAMVLHSGHATNVSTISHLYGQGDLIVHDELSHNSLVLGAEYSGAKRLAFPHNDWNKLDDILKKCRSSYKRVLIIIEGIYSMDGDVPNLLECIRVKKRHSAWLMVDEAHSIGVLGEHGAGIGEHFKVARGDVDIWMGTLSKAFASNGGYIAGQKELIEYLKYTAPSSIFSAGATPSCSAAALAAIEILGEEPERLQRLKELSALARETALEHDFDIGFQANTPVLPIIIGDSKRCFELSRACKLHGVNVKPIIYPAVPKHLARLRFFITANHKPAQIKRAFGLLAKLYHDAPYS